MVSVVLPEVVVVAEYAAEERMWEERAVGQAVYSLVAAMGSVSDTVGLAGPIAER